MNQPASALWKNVLKLVENRLALLSVEVREERDFALHLLILCLATLIMFSFFLAMLGIAVFLFVPTEYRPWTALAISLVYLGLGMWSYRTLRRSLREKGEPFEMTRQELHKDFE